MSSTSKERVKEQRYALVSNNNDNNNDALPLSDIRQSKDTTQQQPQQQQQQQQQQQTVLCQIYERYAELYPNPQLVQEYLERDRLLKQIWIEQEEQKKRKQQEEEEEEQQQQGKNPNQQKKRKTSSSSGGGGFFSFFLGRRSNTKSKPNEKDALPSTLDASKYLEYTEISNTQSTKRQTLINSGLSMDCIPQEAHAVARLYQTSFAACNHNNKADNNDTNNTSINGIACVVHPVLPTTTDTSSSCLVILDVGIVAEYSQREQSSGWTVGTTNDFILLQEAVQLMNQSSSSSAYSPALIRATWVSDSIVAISWGFEDGLTVLYQKTPNSAPPSNKASLPFPPTWKSIAMVSPARVVLQHLQSSDDGVFLQNNTDGTLSSQWLRIADLRCVVMQGTIPILTIARLGGYLELLPLPPDVWIQLPPPTMAMPSARPRKKKLPHYAMGILFNLATEEEQLGTVALTVLEHHADVMKIAMQPLNGNQSLMAVTGMRQLQTPPPAAETEHEFDFSEEQPEKKNETAPSSEQPEQNLSLWIISLAKPLQVEFYDAASLPSMGGISLFASPKILEHWRHPRHVSRKAIVNTEEIDGAQNESTAVIRPASLSIPAPVTNVCFLPGPESLRLAVLDANGGVLILHCQLQNQEEPVCSLFLSRSDMVRKIGRSPVVDIAPMQGSLLVITKSHRVYVVSSKPVVRMALPPNASMARFVGSFQLVFRYSHPAPALHVCRVQELDASHMIRRLVDLGKYQEAIETAADRSSLAGLVEECHVKLWESPQDPAKSNNSVVKHLDAISNDEYVVNQVLAILSGNRLDLSLDDCRRACQIGVRRLDTLRVASALQLPKDKDALKEDFLAAQITMGTYQLLAQHFEQDTYVQTYLESFHSNSQTIQSLAASLAKRGDIAGLTLVLWRHTGLLSASSMEIVEQIPVSVDPMSLAHLLPSMKPDGFLVTHESNASFYDWTNEMVWFAEDFRGMGRIVLDDNDKEIVMAACRKARGANGNNGSGVMDEQALVVWYQNRYSLLQRTVGNLSFVVSFCDLAIKCLSDGSETATNESVTHFVSVRKCAECLDELLLAGGSSDEALLYSSVDDLRLKPLEDIVSILLGVPSDAHEIPGRFQNNVLPIVSSLPSDASSEEKIDGALSEYCFRLLRGTQVDREHPYEASKNIRKNLAICAVIASASRSSLKKIDRMIKARQVLLEMVLSVKEEVSSLCAGLDLLTVDARALVDLLWQAYESLPSQPAPGDDENLRDLDTKTNGFYRELVATEILAPWAPSVAFSCLKDSNNTDAAILLCEAFCSQIKSNREGSHDGRTKVMLQFLSDLQSINQVRAESKLDLPRTVQGELLPALLQAGQFHVFADLLETDLGREINFEEIQSLVVRFLDDSIGQDGLQLAMDCQDILGSRFPEIGHRFDHVRKYLDAAQFINPIGNFTFTPAALKEMLPLDVIITVLRENPRCVLHECDRWLESDYARVKNMEMIETLLSNERSWKELSTAELPGGAVLHLSSILFFDGSPVPASNSFVVRALLFEAMLQIELPWVAASFAIQNVFACEADGDPKFESLRFEIVANLVKYPKYDDILVKKALCTTVLKKWKGCIREAECPSVITIMEALQDLELKTSRFSPDAWSLEQMYGNSHEVAGTDRRDFAAFGQVAGALAGGVKSFTGAMRRPKRQDEKAKNPLVPRFKARAIDRVFRDTLSGYSTNLGNLFSILRTKASKCNPDDPLLQALNRYTLFWCIANAVKVVNVEPQAMSVDSIDARETLALGTAILLHAGDASTINENASELLQILETQSHDVMRTASLFSLPPVLKPDLHIVRELVTRGFTENGARRAAVMTENKSVQVALVWAVANSDERNFNNPIVLVKSFTEQYLNQKAMHDISECLVLSRLHAGGQKSLSSFIPFRTSESLRDLCNSDLPGMVFSAHTQKETPSRSTARGVALPPKPLNANTTSGLRPRRENGDGETHQKPKQNVAERNESRPIPPLSSGTDDAVLSKSLLLPKKETKKSIPSSSTKVATSSRSTRTLPSLFSTDKKPVPKSKFGFQAKQNGAVLSTPTTKEAPTKPVKLPRSPEPAPPINPVPPPKPPPLAVPKTRTAPPPPPPPPPPRVPAPRSGPLASVSSVPRTPRAPNSQPLDRAALRKSGELARQRGMNTQLTPEERTRLIEKGRRLLERARGSPPKALTPTCSPPNLLSRSSETSSANAGVNEESKSESQANEPDGWDFEDF